MKAELFNDNWTVSKRGGSVGIETAEGLRSVTLPYDAMIMEKRSEDAVGSFRTGYYPGGVWEFKKRFFVPTEYARKKVTFRFDGVYARSSVYINGDYAGDRAYGYSQFFVDADRLLKYGQENEITVIARSTDDSRWYSGCGIYRDVYMLTAERTYIVPNGMKLSMPDISEDEARILVVVKVYNGETFGKETVRVSADILDRDGKIVGHGTAPLTVDFGAAGALSLSVYIPNPHLWDADDPYLYTCRVSVAGEDGAILDEDTEAFGIRSITVSPTKGLQINGKTVKLRGACLHHDNGPLGAVSTELVEERKIRKLKEAGFNAIRCAHNPASQALLRACDRLGMFVMNEVFDVWTQPKVNFDYSMDFPHHWEEDVESFVESSFNHTSVIIYSVGNEIPETGSPGGTRYGRAIAERIKSLDASRPTVNSINGMMSVMSILTSLRDNSQAETNEGGDINKQMTDLGEVMSQIMRMPVITSATEEAYASVDIAGYNYMDVRYEDDRRAFPNRVICGTETYPPRIAKNWELIGRCDHVIGDFTWTGWDYLGEAGIGLVKYEKAPYEYGVSAPYPFLTAWCGDITISGFRRPVSYYREIVFGLRKEPYIAVERPDRYGAERFTTPWSWSDSAASWSYDGFEGKPVKVEIYSDAEEVALYIGDARIGTKKPEHKKAVFETVYKKGEIRAVNIRNDNEAESFTLRSAEGGKKLTLRPEKQQVATGELIFVEIAVQDNNGNLFTEDRRKVTVSAEGAELVAFANDDPQSEENFFDRSRSLYDGRALAIVRPCSAGEVILRGTLENLTAECRIIVE